MLATLRCSPPVILTQHVPTAAESPVWTVPASRVKTTETNTMEATQGRTQKSMNDAQHATQSKTHFTFCSCQKCGSAWKTQKAGPYDRWGNSLAGLRKGQQTLLAIQLQFSPLNPITFTVNKHTTMQCKAPKQFIRKIQSQPTSMWCLKRTKTQILYTKDGPLLN